MNQTISVKFAFGIVFLSVLLALIIGSIVGALDPSILAGSKPGLSTYFAMFVGQGFLAVPVIVFLVRKKYPLLESLRFNPVSKDTALTTLLFSLGAVVISDEINILVGTIIASFQASAGAWASNERYATSNQQNLLDNTANNIYLSGVQLEVGSVATDFAHEDYGTTLRKCQRYYIATGVGTMGGALSVYKRQVRFGDRRWRNGWCP